MPTFDYVNLKQFILKNHIDSIQNKTARMENITRELLRLSDVLDMDEPKHLVGLIYYFGIGVIADKKKAIVLFRKIAGNSGLLETLIWLMTIYLQDDRTYDLCANPKTAEDYYRKAKKLYNGERHTNYTSYIEFAEMVALYMGDSGKKKSALKIYEQMIYEAEAIENMEIHLLLEEFKKIHSPCESHVVTESINELVLNARKSFSGSFESKPVDCKTMRDEYASEEADLDIFNVPSEKPLSIFDIPQKSKKKSRW